MREDGQLVLRLKNAWRDGTTSIVLTPFQLLERLAALSELSAESVIDALVPLEPHGVTDEYGLQQLLVMLDEMGLPREGHPGVRQWTPEELVRG